MAKESKEKKKTTETKAAEKKTTEKKGKKAYSEAQVERRKAVTDFLKSLIVPLIFCAIIGGFVMFVINFVNPTVETEPVKPYGFAGGEDPLVMETDELIFTMDPTTTYFTVEQKGTGKVWASYIEDASTDSQALKNEKGKMQSNILLSYAVTTGLETVYDSKTCLRHKLFHLLSVGQGCSRVMIAPYQKSRHGNRRHIGRKVLVDHLYKACSHHRRSCRIICTSEFLLKTVKGSRESL